jgi:hypothetical protein
MIGNNTASIFRTNDLREPRRQGETRRTVDLGHSSDGPSWIDLAENRVNTTESRFADCLNRLLLRVSVNPGHRFQQFADRDFSNYGTGIPLNRGQSRRLVFGGAVQAMFFLKLEFERGNAETEASETDHCERPTIDPEADV